MGVLPGRFRERSKRIAHALMELYSGPLHTVPLAPRVGPFEALRRGHVEQKGQIGHETPGCESE